MLDFEFGRIHARDFGLMVCTIDGSSGVETTSIGAEINFNMVSAMHGGIQYITDTTYDNVLETTFNVCKFDCKKGHENLTVEEVRIITRWLQRDEFCLFKPISDDSEYDNIYYEGSFDTVKKVELEGKIIGLELHFTTNRPFALEGKRMIKITADSADYEFEFTDSSDKIGYIYPTLLTVTIPDEIETETVDVAITNSVENRKTVIKNCSAGEIITFYDILDISSSLNTDTVVHQVQNDFNYTFFRIANTYKNKTNKITISTPCEVYFEYYPIVKGVGF